MFCALYPQIIYTKKIRKIFWIENIYICIFFIWGGEILRMSTRPCDLADIYIYIYISARAQGGVDMITIYYTYMKNIQNIYIFDPEYFCGFFCINDLRIQGTKVSVQE